MKKISLFIFIFAWIHIAGLCFPREVALSAQWTMQNNTRFTLDFYIDDVYQGQAFSGGFWPSQVEAGKHTLKARSRDGKFVKTKENAEIKEGESKTWVVEPEK